MMSLVAYGSSGESENESDNEVDSPSIEEITSSETVPASGSGISPKSTLSSSEHVPATASSNVGSVSMINSKSNLHSKLPPPKAATTDIVDPDIDPAEHLSLGSKLPVPKHHTTPSLLQSSVVVSANSKGKSKKGIVKIMIPSLSDFPEDEDEPKAKKKIQPSAKGSGLFALLPPPKQASVKEANRSLVPNVLTRKPTPAPPIKRPIPKTSAGSAKRKQPDSDPESGEEDGSTDFFSLNKEDNLPDVPMADISSIVSSSAGISVPIENPSPNYEQSMVQGEYQYQQNEQLTENVALSGQDYIPFAGGRDLELDDEAIKKLCGRRGRNTEDIQILDVSGDAIMPDQREWLTKQLTEEQPRHSSKSKLHGPSSQQKKKHQITYLAHIAKENELELKNQWANNRQTRKQTQSKYGF